MVKNFLSKVLFSYVAPVIRIGRSRPLTANDMPPLMDDIHPNGVAGAFADLPTKKPYTFIWKSFFATGRSAVLALSADAVRLPFAFAGPLLLQALLRSVEGVGKTSSLTALNFDNPILVALFLAVTVIGDGVVIQHFYFNALRTYARITNGLNLKVYNHALRLTRSAQMTTQTGDIVNHLASDSEGVAEASFFIPEFLHSTTSFIFSAILLWNFLGTASLFALGTLLLMSPIARLTARRFEHTDSELWKHRDSRITLMSQILSGIRIIKYFVWEKSIVSEVDAIRSKEIQASLKLVRNEALGTMIFLSTSTAVSLVGFGAYTWLGGSLTPSIVFPCLLLFMQLEGPVGMLPHFIKNLAHARVAAERLHKYFSLGLYDEMSTIQESEPNKAVSISIKNLTVDFPSVNVIDDVVTDKSNNSILQTTTNQNEGETVRALDSLSLEIKAGQSVALIGSVGAGKSTLLMTLLGEVTHTDGGEIRFNNSENLLPRVAYVAQEPYIMNATIEQNILFGTDRDSSIQALPSMNDVLANTALEQDIREMPAGLNTEIGERGVNLSGGQKMRVALARAVMHRPGLVLLDDPLAAVDVHTEEHLVEQLLFGQWKSITRVVTTHRLAHLRKFDRVIMLDKGSIVCEGTYNECVSTSQTFRDFIAEHVDTDESLDESKNRAQVKQDHVKISLVQSNDGVNHTQANQTDASQHSGKLMDDEDRAIGSIKFDLFLTYIRALAGAFASETTTRGKYQRGWFVYLSLAFTCTIVVVLPMTQSIWLGWWSNSVKSGVYYFEWMQNNMLAISVYGVLGVLVLLANYTERLVWMTRATLAGRDIHNRTLHAVLSTRLRFFDTTPMGRILNRFARDMEGVDDHLAWNFESAVRSFALMIGTLILILFTAPVVILFALPSLFIFYRIQHDYRKSAREAKRLESISRSPRYAHFKETITGLTTIRAYRKEDYFTKTFTAKLSEYQRMYMGSILLNRWFSSRVPVVSGVIALATAVSVVIMIRSGSMSEGIAGVVITYAMTFWGNLNWCVRSFSEVESRMTSFERLMSYSNLEPEPQVVQARIESVSVAKQVSSTQPQKGSVEFANVFARYADGLPYVLRGVNFSIEGGARVGIVGRTGSGKTTLFQTLFRFIDIERGSIMLDGVNIASIPLDELRSSIAVIPQDPTLFVGTVRSNLDRFNLSSDEELWTALRRVKMDSVIESIGGLSAPVAENGYNFSQGQRQLLCLTRAILSSAKVIVMDEATASVDMQTDALIQETIRSEFAGITILIIAHRLNSIADADYILEMDRGIATLKKNSSDNAVELDTAMIE
jgi:ABC-type multidrug transport system fused ATPase/permease subunit